MRGAALPDIRVLLPHSCHRPGLSQHWQEWLGLAATDLGMDPTWSNDRNVLPCSYCCSRQGHWGIADTSLPGLVQTAGSPGVTPCPREGTRACHLELSLCHPPASVPHSPCPAQEKCLGPVALLLAPPSQRVVGAGSPPGTTRSVRGLHPAHAGITVSPLVALVVVTCLLSQRCSQHKAKSQAICSRQTKGEKKRIASIQCQRGTAQIKGLQMLLRQD